jgi:protease-4
MQRDSRGATATNPAYVVAVVAAVLTSAVLAPVAWGAVEPSTDGTVAVVTLQGSIGATSADATVEDLQEVRRNDSVDAVVLKVDSPGGGVASSERLYLAVSRLAEEKPVVASVQTMGASGAYYAMLPAERIYTLPSSMVGSVGVFAQTGGPVPDTIVRSGPDKATAAPGQVRRQVEALQETFLDSVYRHRGDRLELSRAALSHGKIYRGTRAVRFGVADEVGSLPDATTDAAERANLDSYDVYRKEPPGRPGLFVLGGSDGTVAAEDPFSYAGVETTRFMMLHGQPRPVATDVEVANAST